MANSLVDILKSGDKDALNAYLSTQSIGSNAGGMTIGGQPNNALSTLMRPQMQQMPQNQQMPQQVSQQIGNPSSGVTITNASLGYGPMGVKQSSLGGVPGYYDSQGNFISQTDSGDTVKVSAGELAQWKAEGDRARQQQALADQFAQAKVMEQIGKAKEAMQSGGMKPTFNADAGGYVYPPTPDNPQGKFVPVQGLIGKQGGTGNRIQDAQDAMMILQQAAPLIDQSTHSGIGSLVDLGAGAIGVSTRGSIAADQLKVLGGALVSKMPKMSGPQSDKDVAMYKEMAGRIGDPTIPADRKKAAMQTIMELQSKYAGTKPLELQFSQQPTVSTHPQDLQAIQWAKSNPSDPRSAAILKANGY